MYLYRSLVLAFCTSSSTNIKAVDLAWVTWCTDTCLTSEYPGVRKEKVDRGTGINTTWLDGNPGYKLPRKPLQRWGGVCPSSWWGGLLGAGTSIAIPFFLFSISSRRKNLLLKWRRLTSRRLQKPRAFSHITMVPSVCSWRLILGCEMSEDCSAPL